MKNLLIYACLVFQLFFGCTNQKNNSNVTSLNRKKDSLYIKDDQILQFKNFSDINFTLERDKYQHYRVNLDRSIQDSLLTIDCSHYSLKMPMLHFIDKNLNYCYIGDVKITDTISSQLYLADDNKSKKILLINSISNRITSAALVYELNYFQPKGIHVLNEGLYTVLLKDNILMTIIELRGIGNHSIKNILFTIFEIDTNGYIKNVNPKSHENLFTSDYFNIQDGW